MNPSRKRARLSNLQPRVPLLSNRIVEAAPKVAEAFYSSPDWLSLMRKLKAERGERCEQCGRTGTRIFGDHIVELRDGGASLEPRNVQLLCGAHHSAKTASERAKRAATRHSRE